MVDDVAVSPPATMSEEPSAITTAREVGVGSFSRSTRALTEGARGRGACDRLAVDVAAGVGGELRVGGVELPDWQALSAPSRTTANAVRASRVTETSAWTHGA